MNISEGIVAAAFSSVFAVGIALSIIDFRTHRLPNAIVLPSYLVGFVLLGSAALLAGDGERFVRSLSGMLLMFTAYFVLALPRRQGIGMGDVKLAGLLGLHLTWLGWGSLAVGFFGAFLLGGIVSGVLLVLRRANRASRIPFGPWMIAGAVIGALWGEVTTRSYLTLVGFTLY
jgi:leader peptidase (prepilin peptidase)/N-methyltransferase